MITTDIFKFICQSLIYRLDRCFTAVQFSLFIENKKMVLSTKINPQKLRNRDYLV